MKPDRSVIPCIFHGSHRHLSTHSSLKPPHLEGSWDSHIHLIEPQKYPLPRNVNPPKEATMSQALANAEHLGLPNMVFVQLSAYGNDNTWILDALREVGLARGRGVVAFNPEQVDSQTLKEWHNLGVRGVRLNFRSSKTAVLKAEIRTILRKYAEKLRPMKTWSIGLYADMEILDHIEPLLPELQVKLVFEHFASPAILPLDPGKQPGWDALKNMMQNPLVFTKISAPYLFSKDPGFNKFETLTKALMSIRNGDGVVFGSDWPHTQSRGYDAKPFMDKVVEWCDRDVEKQKKLLRDNAKELWDVD